MTTIQATCMAHKILIVDDEPNLREMIRTYLEQEGFQVVEAANGREALFVARHEKPDLIVLDWMMPEMNGPDFLRAHSKEARTPVILLTARVDDHDKIIGLEIGADDYVTKPFNVRELTARVRAVLRRATRVVESEVLRVGDIELDRGGATVKVNAAQVDLTKTEFELLAALMSPQAKCSRDWTCSTMYRAMRTRL